MTTTTTNHRGLAAPAFSTHFSVGHMPATTTTSGDFSMQPSSVSASTTERPLASAAAPSLTGQALQCIGVISRSLVGIAIVAARGVLERPGAAPR